MGWKSFCVILLAAVLASGCGRSKKKIVVGAKDTVAQQVLAEIVAQHLEHRLGRTVVRNTSLGSTATTYLAFLNGEVGIYPEDTGTMQAAILKENPSPDPGSTLERVRNEMRRVAQAEVLDPLGIDNSWAVLISTAVPQTDARNQIDTLTDATHVLPGWKLGITRDFNERNDGLSAFNQYRLPMRAMTYVGDSNAVYDAFQTGTVTMIVGNMTDAWLGRHVDWKALRDDRRVFGSYQTCLLARQDLLANDPKIQPALAELSGRISTEMMQKMDAQVSADKKKPAEVAAEFLKQAGLN
jgi:glycine betaine/choline ABC-type transport system substrate-binding protein